MVHENSRTSEESLCSFDEVKWDSAASRSAAVFSLQRTRRGLE